MRSAMRHGILAAGLFALATLPAGAQAPPVMADLLADVGETERKIVGLAKAIPEPHFAWRPMEGVRSVREVLQHVAADNYLLPAFVGVTVPASLGINPTDYATVQKFEARTIDRATAIAELEASFAHLKKAMEMADASKAGESVTFFGTTMTRQRVWVLTTTHLHEHLGQLIAYARSNSVVPPWSRGGN